MQFWIMDLKLGDQTETVPKNGNSPQKNHDPLNVFFECKDIQRGRKLLLKRS